MPKVLIVEDDESLSASIQGWLEYTGFKAELCSDGKQALELLDTYDYDLIILDWSIPNISGVDVCQQYRESGKSAPILMLTGKSTVQDKVMGLDSGADDYLTKPFHLDELMARVRALLRRPEQINDFTLKAKDLELDVVSRRVFRGGKELHLMPQELDLLEFLMRNPGRVFSVQSLLNRVWPSHLDSSLDAVYTCIGRLRKKVDQNGDEPIISTVHKSGYRLNS